MATIVNNPSGTGERVVERDMGDSGAGWALAIIVLLVVLAVGAYLFAYRAPGAATPLSNPANPGANINVQLPSGGTPSSGTTNTTNTTNTGSTGTTHSTQTPAPAPATP